MDAILVKGEQALPSSNENAKLLLCVEHVLLTNTDHTAHQLTGRSALPSNSLKRHLLAMLHQLSPLLPLPHQHPAKGTRPLPLGLLPLLATAPCRCTRIQGIARRELLQGAADDRHVTCSDMTVT